MGKKRTNFDKSVYDNTRIFYMYFNKLLEIALGRYRWKNMPLSVDVRFLELQLVSKGCVSFFKDDVLGYLSLPVSISGKLNVYNIPTRYVAYASNGYNNELDNSNSVLIYNNLLHSPITEPLEIYSEDLTNIDRTIQVNINAQKTPLLIQCAENQRLTMENVYMKYQGNQPAIFANNDFGGGVKVLKTDAPFLANHLFELKQNIWNEALSFLGVTNIIEKKERLISSEVETYRSFSSVTLQGGLQLREKACDEINKMFGLNVSVSLSYDDWGNIENERIYNNS